MLISREWAMPSGDTFSIKPISELLDRYLVGAKVIIDPFARMSKRGTITNDLNPEMPTDYNMHATDFLLKMKGDGVVADAILLDPPYSSRQAKELYESLGHDFTQDDSRETAGHWPLIKDLIYAILRRGGIAVRCGWNSNGVGRRRGRSMEMVEVLLVAHGGGHNDTIVTVERKL